MTRRRALLILFALVFVKASAYWIGSSVQRPEDPFSTIVIYRGKDIQSFPILANLSQFGFGEPSLAEGHDAGVLSERYVPWALHALLLRWLGLPAFVVADVLMTALHFFLLTALLELAGVRFSLASAASAAAACAAIDNFGEQFSLLEALPIRLWGLRIPRPFVSELFLLTSLLGAVSISRGLFEGRRQRIWEWALLGIGASLLLQSDFYTAAGLGLGLLILLAAHLHAGGREQRKEILRGTACAALVGGIAIVPMLVQSAYLNPEGPIRLGLFAISRLRPPLITSPVWIAALIVLVALALWMERTRAVSTRPGRSGRLVLLACCFGAVAAMPFVTIVTGTGIELYHYRDSFTRFFSLAALAIGLQILTLVVQRFFTGSRSLDRLARRFDVGVIAIALASGLAFSGKWAIQAPRNSAHMRADFPEWGSLPDYRSSFVALATELSHPKYDERRVLGTFDTQLWSWWVTFRGGYSYLPDACTSNARDSEIERRLASFSKLIGMDPSGFVAFARRPYVNIFWLGCSKYQASKAFTFAPLEDYEEADRRRAEQSSIFQNFLVALPRGEQARLADIFTSMGPEDLSRIDLIVLTKDESTTGLAPSAAEWDLVFEDPVFRLWMRREPAPQQETGAVDVHHARGR